MEILFDNILFSLQKAGGISVVWEELLKRALSDKDLSCHFLDKPSDNIFRKKLHIPDEQIIKDTSESYPIHFQRYLNPKRFKAIEIFHSSYYRTIQSPNIINVTTVHDFTYEKFRKGIPKFLHSYQKAKAIRNSAVIICVSHNTKEDLLQYYPEIKEEDVQVIYNGVNKSYRFLSDDRCYEKLIKCSFPFASGEYVLFVGDRKSDYKNFELSVISCKATGSPLVIVGGGNISKKEDKFLQDQIGINNFIHFNGISNEQLNLLYNHALCLLYPSLYEGFGIPILEAQKAGCPVITTKSSSIPEVAGSGALFLEQVNEKDIAEKIVYLRQNSSSVTNLQKKGFKNAEGFSWDKCYQETKALYKQVYEKYS